MRMLIVALLASSGAFAQSSSEMPNGPWSIGAGLFAGSAIGGQVEGRLDLAVSVAGTYEEEFWFVGLEGLAAQVGERSPQSLLGVLRAGFVAPWSIAPFLAFGMAGMNQKLRGDVNGDGSGFAVIGELGVMLFRDRRVGRGTISLMGVEPAFHVVQTSGKGAVGTEFSAPLLLVGVRLLL